MKLISKHAKELIKILRKYKGFNDRRKLQIIIHKTSTWRRKNEDFRLYDKNTFSPRIAGWERCVAVCR